MPFAAALSTERDSWVAVQAVIAELRAALAKPELLVVFFGVEHSADAERITQALRRELAPEALIGCVAESLVGCGREIEDGPALSVWAASWNGAVAIEPFQFRTDQTPDGLSLFGWPDALFEGASPDDLMILLGDPFTFPALELFLPRANEDYPGLPIVGGMASGTAGPGQTILLHGDRIENQGATGVLLRGPSGFRSIVSQGCRPIGKPWIVTKCEENVIRELGGRVPMAVLQDIYRELPESERSLFQSGLHIGLAMTELRERFERGDFLIRNLFGLDRATGALAIMDNVRLGQTIQFHVRDAVTADEELRTLLQRDRERFGVPGGGLLFTCNGRGTRLFRTPNHDAGTIAAVYGAIPTAGLFAAGELGPVGGRNYLHGFTASLVLFTEAHAATTPPPAPS